MKIRLKYRKKRKSPPKLQLDSLRKDENIKTQYAITVKNRFEGLQEVTTAEEKWDKLRDGIQVSLQEHVPPKPRKAHKKWVMQDILNLMEKRRKKFVIQKDSKI